jgi:hypothetical protein
MSPWSTLFRSDKRRNNRSPKAGVHFALEQLEDRLTPATHAVTGALLAASGNLGQNVMAAVTRETVGAFDPASGQWYLRDSNQLGAPSIAPFRYGAPGWTPVVGDWDGNGTATLGVVDPSTMTWYLHNSNSSGAPDLTPFQYGAPGDIPVVGDWDGNGTTTIGVVDPSTMTWYLRNSNSPGAPDITPFRYGAPGWTPVAGNWNGGGKTGIGVVDPTTATWYLRNSASNGAAEVAPFAYGGPGWTPVVGDWDANGTSTVGSVDPAGTWYLRNTNTTGTPSVQPFAFGGAGWKPVTGAWDASNVLLGLRNVAPTQTATLGQPQAPPQTPAGPPILSLSSTTVDPLQPNTLELNGITGTRALGELTISNTGPAGSVLHYQLRGALGGYYYGEGLVPFTLSASAPVGQVQGGHSVQVLIVADTTGYHSLSMVAGWSGGLRVVSDSRGVVSAVTIPMDTLASTQVSHNQMNYLHNLENEQSALFGPAWAASFGD